MTSAMRAVSEIAEATDPKKAILDKLQEPLKSVDLMENMVLLATYIRPAKTAGGVWRPDTNLQEDIYQGKVGLLVKAGPSAFSPDGEYSFKGAPEIGDWVVYRVGDAWSLNLNGYPCRLVKDIAVRMKIKDPNVIF